MTDTNLAKFKKLVTLLKELFQLDQPDLDFGIYRIMHAKAGEVTQFLERDLLPQVKDAFAQYQSADSAELKKKLEQMTAQLTEAGVDPETAPKVRELREQIKGAIDLGALENEVYDHLYSFFRRYYSEGDFLAKRVYKPCVYAIPYEGEEVTLHWANKDQYYIKTSEYLRDYAFRLNPEAGTGEDPMRVHFKLVDAAEGEHGNVKAVEGKDRAFILVSEDFIGVENGELELRFEYRPATLEDWPIDQREGKKKPPSQRELTAFAVERVLAMGQPFKDWIPALAKSHIKADGELAEYTRLEAHLRRYTARNTFDYFIHKDLGGFLRRELDFYIKNEVMHLDDVESETAAKVEQYLSKIKVIRRIASKIIDFLAQLENFQKKLWLKKKFVVGTDWLVAVSQVPDNLLPEVCENAAQLEEWETLHALHELPVDITRPAWSEPLSPDYLRALPSLKLDTRHFDEVFVARLLESVGDLDANVDGVLMRSENFQALSLMQARYRGRVHCIYIDPPYNTERDRNEGKFLYKDGYDESSWLALISDRLDASRALLRAGSTFFCSIDDNEIASLKALLDIKFGRRNFIDIFSWLKTTTPAGLSKKSKKIAEYVLAYEKEKGGARYTGIRKDASSANTLLNQPNRPSELVFPVGTEVGFSDCVIRPGSYGTDKYDVELLTDLVAVEGKLAAPARLRARFRWTQDYLEKQLADGVRVRFATKSLSPSYEKDDYGEETPPNVIDKKVGVDTNENASTEFSEIMGDVQFPYPKPPSLVEYLANFNTPKDGVLFDYFAGSGTSGHAVINLNREDGGRRQFVLVEVGGHFETALVPRLKKISFTPEWRNGRPKRLATADEADRGPRLIKILRLESYEDTLNNLALSRSTQQQATMDLKAAQGADSLREQYLLRYQLNVESRGNASLLNVNAFSDPAAYKLKVKTPGSDEIREVNVDLLETFNWLLGLTVQHIAAPRSFAAEFERGHHVESGDGKGRLQLKGRLKQDAAGLWWFRTVIGTTPEGRKILVIWRKLTGDAEQDNLVLETWFRDKQAFSVKDTEFDLIYVNGDNTLENLRLPDETWKVRLTEEDFQRLMFEGTEA